MERKTTYDVFGIEVHKGWHALVRPFADLVLEAGGRMVQIKEKFGTLCLYFDMPAEHVTVTDEMSREELTRAYRINWMRENAVTIGTYLEYASRSICEDCGATERVALRRAPKYWMRTLCETCAKEEGYGIEDEAHS